MGRNGNGPKWSWAEMVMGRNDPESGGGGWWGGGGYGMM